GEADARGRAGAAGAQGLDLLAGRHAPADAGVDDVAAFAGSLGDLVAGIVDIVGVVAGSAGHRVDASAAIEDVVAGAAVQAVVVAVAGEREAAGGVGAQDLDLGARGQTVVDGRIDRVGAFAGGLGHLVGRVADIVGVAARAARHGVDPGAADDGVGHRAASDGVVAGRPVHRERVAADGPVGEAPARQVERAARRHVDDQGIGRGCAGDGGRV